MSNELKVYQAGQFAIVKDERASERLALAIADHGIKMRDLPVLQIPGGKSKFWELDTPTGRQAVEKLDVVIAHVVGNQKGWWAEDLEGGDSNRPPSCSSTDGLVGRGNNRLDQDPKGISDKHDCLTCAWNQFGSERKYKRGKDCKDFANLFLFSPTSRLPMVLKIPATSLDAMRAHFIQKLYNLDLEPWTCVSRLGLAPAPKSTPSLTWNVVTFDLVAPLDEVEKARFLALRETIKKYLHREPLRIVAGDFATKDPNAKEKAEVETAKTEATKPDLAFERPPAHDAPIPEGSVASDAFGRPTASEEPSTTHG